LPVLVLASACGDSDSGQPPAVDVHAPLYGTFIGRNDLARFPLFAKSGLNAVVLGHTFTSELVRQPFDQAGLDQVRLFFTTARDNGLQLVFKMTPQRGYGADFPFPGPDDPQRATEIALIVGKVDTLYDIGVRIFMICFDDISQNAPQSGFMPAEAEAALLRAVDARLQARNPNGTRLMVTPPYYAGTAEAVQTDKTPFSPHRPLNYGLPPSRDFLQEYGALPKRVEIFSTGPGIFSANFSAVQIAALATLWGHPIDYWSNYPTNDIFADELVLEPFTRLEAGALPGLRAVLLNRAPNFPEASNIGVLTFGEFLAHPMQYDPQGAYQRAVDTIGAGAAAALRLVADQFQSHPVNRSAQRNESEEPRSRFAEFWSEEATCTTGPGTTALRDLLTRFMQAPHDLDAGLTNRALYAELQPHAEKLAAIGAAGLFAVDALLTSCAPGADAAERGTLAAGIESRRTALAALPSRITEDSVPEFAQVISGDGPAFAPTNIVDDFLSQARDQLNAAARAAF
jgi:hypothetical protein